MGMNAAVHAAADPVSLAAIEPLITITAPAAPAAPVCRPSRPAVLGWLEPRLARRSPVPPGQVRLIGVVVHDPTFADSDTAARAAWIGDGTCPLQVMAAHAADLSRYDVVVGVTWHDDGPEPVVVLVNP
jgi:hypothetical protein